MQRTIQTFEYFQRGAESANSLLLVSDGAALKRIFGALGASCIHVVYKSQTGCMLYTRARRRWASSLLHCMLRRLQWRKKRFGLFLRFLSNLNSCSPGSGSNLQRKGCKSLRGWKWFNFSTLEEDLTEKVPNWKGDEIWKPRRFQRCIFRPGAVTRGEWRECRILE